MEEYDYKLLTEKLMELFEDVGEELAEAADIIAGIFGQALDTIVDGVGDLIDYFRDLAPINPKPKKRWRLQRKGVGHLSERKTRPMTHRPDYG